MALVCFGLIIAFHTVPSKPHRSSWHWPTDAGLSAARGRQFRPFPFLIPDGRTLISFKIAKRQAKTQFPRPLWRVGGPRNKSWPVFHKRKCIGQDFWANDGFPGTQATLLLFFAFLAASCVGHSCHLPRLKELWSRMALSQCHRGSELLPAGSLPGGERVPTGLT